MIDPKLLRQSAADVAANLARRGFAFDARPTSHSRSAARRCRSRPSSCKVSAIRAPRALARPRLRARTSNRCWLRSKISVSVLQASERRLQDVQAELSDIELGLPNLLADDVPDGTARTIISRCGAGANRSNSDSTRATILSSGRTSACWISMRRAASPALASP